jgi:hypothetical protein
MPNLEIVSALEVEIVVEHVGSYLDEAGAEQSQEEGGRVEDMGELKRDYSSKNYWDKGRLEEWDAHGLGP